MPNIKRNCNIHFMVTEEERDMIKRRMEQSGMKNMRAYMLKMAIDGRVIHVEFESIREMVRLLSSVSNNIKAMFVLGTHFTAKTIKAFSVADYSGQPINL